MKVYLSELEAIKFKLNKNVPVPDRWVDDRKENDRI